MTRVLLAVLLLVQLACVMQTVTVSDPVQECSRVTVIRDERWQWHNVDAVIVGEAENARERMRDE